MDFDQLLVTGGIVSILFGIIAFIYALLVLLIPFLLIGIYNQACLTNQHLAALRKNNPDSTSQENIVICLKNLKTEGERQTKALQHLNTQTELLAQHATYQSTLAATRESATA